MGLARHHGRLGDRARYSFAQLFGEGLAAVRVDGAFGFINKAGGMVDMTGKLAVPLDLGSMSQPFQHGVARVIKEGIITLIKKDGTVVDNVEK